MVIFLLSQKLQILNSLLLTWRLSMDFEMAITKNERHKGQIKSEICIVFTDLFI